MAQDLETEEQEIVAKVLYASVALSVVGSLFIILTYLSFPKSRTPGTKLVLLLSISDLLTSISWLPWNVNSALCVIQAASLQFFQTASFFWSLIICFSLFQAFYLQRLEEHESVKLFPYYHLLSWGYPLVSIIFCLSYQKFGPSGNWCWISDPQDLFRLWVYAPIIFIIIVIMVTFILISLRLHIAQSEFKKKLNRRMSLYLLAFVASQLPAVINRLHNYLYPNDPNLGLFVLQTLFQPSQGFFNSLVYGTTEEVFVEHYRELFSVFKCKKCWKSSSKKRTQSGSFIEEESVPFFDYDEEIENP